jgi:hypothetical protein
LTARYLDHRHTVSLSLCDVSAYGAFDSLCYLGAMALAADYPNGVCPVGGNGYTVLYNVAAYPNLPPDDGYIASNGNCGVYDTESSE